jgi:hypothetical protein
MNPPRYTLPNERPVLVGGRTLFRTGWPLLVVLGLPPMVGYFWQGVRYGNWGWSLVGVIVALGFATLFAFGLLARTTECNRSVFSRVGQPVRYWFTLTVWLAAYGLATVSVFWSGSSR